ncbi:3-hydroxyacyl-ACP dehydratase FabZ [Lacticaseibacillus daqingensis]|uniref:3-hydroxyacyl-ACP dehydratase FabZ n=1 Tax=Lacticaseibacillus daqingensis TaxID=2486014 RepID=UPI000F79ED01|nr:3-hydroxyacyl-ACP dehydratase FabZ [Lacticaseibacillus daqingensis]
MTVMDTVAIRETIPNRFPLFYIDQVTALTPDVAIEAEKYVSIAEDHLVGYLPAELIMPPSLIIETLAQTASILILKSPQFAHRTAYLASVQDARFPRPVPCGSVLKLQVTLTKVRRNTGAVHTTATVNGELVAEAELHFIVQGVDA